jgi:UDP-N-acetylmuramate--alanine ligase
MSFAGINHVYFLGIGGIGMSAIARWFMHEGMIVSGYDRTSSPLTQELIEEGMQISFEDTLSSIPSKIRESSSKSLIIWTPAIPKDSILLAFFKENGYTLHKRSEILGIITRDFHTIAVAGTHGKTTTSSMIAHLLKSAGKPVTAFLGGITQNYQSNLILSDKKSKEKTLVVVEADEFDRSFLQLRPNEAVLTSADPDHLDIYGDEKTIMEGFRQFIHLIERKGRLFIQSNALDRLEIKSLPSIPTKVYGLRSSGIAAANIQARTRSFTFDYHDGKTEIKGLELFIPGFHNVENALAAIAIVLGHKVTEDQIRQGLTSFKGVKRRFEIHVNEPKHVFIDDYAHHPEEIKSCLSSVRSMFPGKKLTVIFQPHLFSRTKDFAKGFSESLSLADEVLLLDIYPARELPIPGVTSEMLLKDIETRKKSVIQKDDLLDELTQCKPEVLVSLGAGDIDRLVPMLSKWMSSQEKSSEI